MFYTNSYKATLFHTFTGHTGQKFHNTRHFHDFSTIMRTPEHGHELRDVSV